MTFLLFPREQEEPSTRSRGMGVDRNQHPRAQPSSRTITRNASIGSNMD